MTRHTFLALLTIRLIPIAAQTLFIVGLLNLAGPSFAGDIAFFIAGVSVFRAAAPLGLDLEVLRISSRNVDNKGFLNRNLLKAATLRVAALTLIGIFIVLLAALMFPKISLILLAIAIASIPMPMMGILVAFLRPARALLKSQAIDAFVSSLAPTLVCYGLLVLGRGQLIHFAFTFLAWGLVSIVMLFRLAWLSSTEHQLNERLNTYNIRDNAISQILLSLNTRTPTFAAAFFASSETVAYIDLGSKIQFIGGTVAWLFGVVQSPIYAKDLDGLSIQSRRLIAKSSKWSMLSTIFLGSIYSFLVIVFAEQLQLDQKEIQYVLSVFTLLAIIETFFVSLGYGLNMTGRSKVISISVLAQVLISFVGIYFASTQLTGILLSLAIGSIVRLILTRLLSRKSVKHA